MPRRPSGRAQIVDVLNPQPAAPQVADDLVRDVAEPLRTSSVPAQDLTPEQLRIRDLENQLALERGTKDPEPELDSAPTGAAGNILIHFVADGHTALGKVWVRGQEIEFARDSQAYHDTCDRNGRSWVDLRDNPAAQEARWREVKFRSGPWPGLSLTAVADQRFDTDAGGPSLDQLREAEQVEARRNRAAPRLPLR